MDSKLKEKLSLFEGIRGLMCILVVLFHYTYRYHEIYQDSFMSNLFSWGGTFGVSVFFVISGFLTTMTSDKITSKGGFWWFKHKATRLYPSYLYSCIVIAITLTLFSLPGRDSITLTSFARSLIMYPVVGKTIDGAHWYVFSLMGFYTFFLFLKKTNLSEKVSTYIVILCIHIISTYLKTKSIFPNGIENLLNVFFVNLRPLTGILIYLSIYKSPKFYPPLILYTTLIGIETTPINVLAIASFYFILIVKNGNLNKFFHLIFKSRILTFIGHFSFMWYLLHQNIGYIIIRLSQDHLGIFPFLPQILASLVTLSLAIISEKILNKFTNKISFS